MPPWHAAPGLFKPVRYEQHDREGSRHRHPLPSRTRRRRAHSPFSMWKAYGELVNLMASEEVWIADAWWPVVVEVASKGIPVHYAVAKEGYRAWCNGYGIAAHSKNVDLAYEWLNFPDGRLSGAAKSTIGYASTSGGYDTSILEPNLFKRKSTAAKADGGSLRARQALRPCLNTRPKTCGSRTQGKAGRRHRRQQGHRPGRRRRLRRRRRQRLDLRAQGRRGCRGGRGAEGQGRQGLRARARRRRRAGIERVDRGDRRRAGRHRRAGLQRQRACGRRHRRHLGEIVSYRHDAHASMPSPPRCRSSRNRRAARSC